MRKVFRRRVLNIGSLNDQAFEKEINLRIRLVCFIALFLVVLAALSSLGQSAPSDSQGAPTSTPADGTSTPAAPAAPAPLPMPSMTGPLATAIPHEIGSSETVGKLQVTDILSGIGSTEGNHITGDSSTHWDVSNAQIFIQKTTGWWQFYLQGGAYNLPAIGVPFLSTGDTMKNIYGPFPQGYLKLVKGNFNVEVGALPTLIGAEYTFSFENMNIERGLLWNQENAVNRGIQLNYTRKKLVVCGRRERRGVCEEHPRHTSSSKQRIDLQRPLHVQQGGLGNQPVLSVHRREKECEHRDSCGCA